MPIIGGNDAVRGAQVGAAITGAFTSSFQASAQFSQAMQRLKMAEDQFKEEMALKDRTMKLQEERFQQQSKLHKLQMDQTKLQVEALERQSEEEAAVPGALLKVSGGVSGVSQALAGQDPQQLQTAFTDMAKIVGTPEVSKVLHRILPLANQLYELHGLPKSSQGLLTKTMFGGVSPEQVVGLGQREDAKTKIRTNVMRQTVDKDKEAAKQSLSSSKTAVSQASTELKGILNAMGIENVAALVGARALFTEQLIDSLVMPPFNMAVSALPTKADLDRVSVGVEAQAVPAANRVQELTRHMMASPAFNDFVRATEAEDQDAALDQLRAVYYQNMPEISGKEGNETDWKAIEHALRLTRDAVPGVARASVEVPPPVAVPSPPQTTSTDALLGQ
jgi:hypothetical protein